MWTEVGKLMLLHVLLLELHSTQGKNAFFSISLIMGEGYIFHFEWGSEVTDRTEEARVEYARCASYYQ
jgi:hypothetical protein